MPPKTRVVNGTSRLKVDEKYVLNLNNVRNISSRTFVISYTPSFLLLHILISIGLYVIDNRNQVLQQAINKQFSVNSIMKELSDISRYHGEIMLLLLDEEDPFHRDDLIKKYNN
ncbi:MAG: hypothetical protein OQK95_06220 [Gammaproteobacteria bacterium]|nr:hypothetical protein [Gammaproteobacteria bacterium]